LAEQAITTARVHDIGRVARRPVPKAPLVAVATEPRQQAPLPDNLSDREAEVLRLVATGRSNREIGEELYISQNTVANHVRAILRKTGCANRTEATRYAVRHDLAD
jgi:DNA-binding NarL/FixJ family response regulator